MSDDTVISVYVHERGKRPRRVGETTLAKVAEPEIEVDGKTYVWVSADLVNRTTTYSDFKAA